MKTFFKIIGILFALFGVVIVVSFVSLALIFDSRTETDDILGTVRRFG